MRTVKNANLITKLITFILILSMAVITVNTESIVSTSYASTGASGKAPVNKSVSDSTTPPAVITPVSIATAQVTPIKDQSYSGKSKKPAVILAVAGKTLVKDVDYTLSYKNNKNPGIATVRVQGKGNFYGTRDVQFRIIIKAPVKVKVKYNQKKVTASWKKMSAVTGYKVYFASNSSFTKKKKVKTLKSRKKSSYGIPTPVTKKTYYVKVQAYKTIKGKTYYSKFSTVKKINVKTQKWIEVDLSKQKVYLRKGKKKVKTYTVSTGKKKTPTVKGTFYIYKKNPKHDMVGQWDPEKNAPEYIQPDVLWSTYFIGGYAFHATYWHSNFGHPMSHGCVNMKTKEAKYLYKWAPIGTKVVVHK